MYENHWEHFSWLINSFWGIIKKNLQFFSLQTHAEYSENAEYIAHQVVQAFDVAQFIRVTSDSVDFSILAADLNSEPNDLCYRIIKNFGGLKDSFEVM